MGILEQLKKEKGLWESKFKDAQFFFKKLDDYYIVKFTKSFRFPKAIKYTKAFKLFEGDEALPRFRRLRKAYKNLIKEHAKA